MNTMIDHSQEPLRVFDPFWGMLVHPRSTMNHLVAYHPGSGAVPMTLMAFLLTGLALYFSGWEFLYSVELPVLVLFTIVAGAFFLMGTTQLIKYISRAYFGATATGAEIKTALAWSMAPIILCNTLIILLSNSPWENLQMEIVLFVMGVVWSFILMDHSLGSVEAYGDGPALLVLSFTMFCFVLAFAVAYFPMWLLTPLLNAWIWYG